MNIIQLDNSEDNYVLFGHNLIGKNVLIKIYKGDVLQLQFEALVELKGIKIPQGVFSDFDTYTFKMFYNGIKEDEINVEILDYDEDFCFSTPSSPVVGNTPDNPNNPDLGDLAGVLNKKQDKAITSGYHKNEVLEDVIDKYQTDLNHKVENNEFENFKQYNIETISDLDTQISETNLALGAADEKLTNEITLLQSQKLDNLDFADFKTLNDEEISRLKTKDITLEGKVANLENRQDKIEHVVHYNATKTRDQALAELNFDSSKLGSMVLAINDVDGTASVMYFDGSIFHLVSDGVLSGSVDVSSKVNVADFEAFKNVDKTFKDNQIVFNLEANKSHKFQQDEIDGILEEVDSLYDELDYKLDKDEFNENLDTLNKKNTAQDEKINTVDRHNTLLTQTVNSQVSSLQSAILTKADKTDFDTYKTSNDTNITDLKAKDVVLEGKITTLEGRQDKIEHVVHYNATKTRDQALAELNFDSSKVGSMVLAVNDVDGTTSVMYFDGTGFHLISDGVLNNIDISGKLDASLFEAYKLATNQALARKIENPIGIYEKDNIATYKTGTLYSIGSFPNANDKNKFTKLIFDNQTKDIRLENTTAGPSNSSSLSLGANSINFKHNNRPIFEVNGDGKHRDTTNSTINHLLDKADELFVDENIEMGPTQIDPALYFANGNHIEFMIDKNLKLFISKDVSGVCVFDNGVWKTFPNSDMFALFSYIYKLIKNKPTLPDDVLGGGASLKYITESATDVVAQDTLLSGKSLKGKQSYGQEAEGSQSYANRARGAVSVGLQSSGNQSYGNMASGSQTYGKASWADVDSRKTQVEFYFGKHLKTIYYNGQTFFATSIDGETWTKTTHTANELIKKLDTLP